MSRLTVVVNCHLQILIHLFLLSNRERKNGMKSPPVNITWNTTSPFSLPILSHYSTKPNKKSLKRSPQRGWLLNSILLTFLCELSVRRSLMPIMCPTQVEKNFLFPSSSKCRLHAVPLAHSKSHGLWICDIHYRREILVAKSKLTGHLWSEAILPGMELPSKTTIPRWSQMAFVSGGLDRDDDDPVKDHEEDNNDLLWTLLHTNRDLYCSPIGESVIQSLGREFSSRDVVRLAKISSSSSVANDLSRLRPLPWRISTHDDDDDAAESFSCISASKRALWGLTPRGDVWVRAGMSRQCPLGKSWRKVDMVQLGQSVQFLAVGT